MFLCHTFDIYPHGVKAKKHFLESNLAQGSIFNQATISVQGDDCPLKMVSLLTSRKRPNPKCPGNSLNAEVPPSPEWLTLSWGRTTNLKGSFIVWKVPTRACYDWFCYDWLVLLWLVEMAAVPLCIFPFKTLILPCLWDAVRTLVAAFFSKFSVCSNPGFLVDFSQTLGP